MERKSKNKDQISHQITKVGLFSNGSKPACRGSGLGKILGLLSSEM